MADTQPRIAIVGATGVVGREALAILAARAHPADRITAIGSSRSAGSDIPYADAALRVQPLTPDAFVSIDFALFCADAEVARAFAPAAAASGAVVIDNSSAFRLDPEVPLVIPEVNGASALGAPIIANPNCSTIILLAALEPIRRRYGIHRIIVSTYQAVSGAGQAGLDELRDQTRAAASSSRATPSLFPEPCALNVFTHESPLDADTGLNGEERKMIAESRRIWGDPALSVLPTCVRVPVERAHSQSVTIELDTPATRDEIEALLRDAPGIDYWPAEGPRHPTPLAAAHGDSVLVGRLRADNESRDYRFSLWLCADQIRKGAALNAIQIMDLVRTASPARTSAGATASLRLAPAHASTAGTHPD